MRFYTSFVERTSESFFERLFVFMTLHTISLDLMTASTLIQLIFMWDVIIIRIAID